MEKKVKNYLFLLIALLLATPILVNSQTQLNRDKQEINDRLLKCESDLFIQDATAYAASQQTKNGGVLIVIVCLGEGENSRELINRRLYNVRKYFKERGSSALASEKVIIAEGEKAKGYGRIEYYLGGELYQQVLFRKNNYVCHSCCGADHTYYPEKADYERRLKRTQKSKRRP